MNRIEIMRCPHCDSKFATCSIVRNLTEHWWDKKYELRCDYCHYNGPRARTIRGAIRNWNRDGERLKQWRGAKILRNPNL